MLYTFYRMVVCVLKPDLPATRERFFVDGETMILGGHVAAAGFEVYARLVLRAVSKFELVCFSTGRESKNLITKADAPRWYFAFEALLDDRNSFGEYGRIARSVRYKDAIKLFFLCKKVVVIGDATDSDTFSEKVADAVIFDAAIDHDDAFAVVFRVAFALASAVVRFWFARAHLGHEVCFVWVIKLFIFSSFYHYFCGHTALCSDYFCECSGVDAGDT